MSGVLSRIILLDIQELFTSVDRTGRGRIGVGALLQILGTTLQRQQLEPDTKLAKQIMETMQKVGSSGKTQSLSFFYQLILQQVGIFFKYCMVLQYVID